MVIFSMRSMRYYQITQYEILNMVKSYCKSGKGIIYKNKVKGSTYTGVLPIKYKDYFLNNGIIKTQDILDIAKIEEMVKDKYLQYIPNRSNFQNKLLFRKNL